MSDKIKRYYKKKVVNQNISVEYSSEDDQVRITIERRLKNGMSVGENYLTLHPSYIEPLYKLLKEATKERGEPDGTV